MGSPALQSTTARVHDPAGAVRGAMAVWAEPVIADCIADVYATYDLGAAVASLLAIQHRRLWRALLLDQQALAARIAAELEHDLHRAGLGHDITAEVDAAVLDELMDIVLARYRASHHDAKACSRVLFAVAARTVGMRAVA